MRIDKNDLLLYAVTDRQWLGEASLAEQLEEAIQAGVTVVQLREKELDFDAFVSLGKELQAVAKRHRIPFIINDAVDVALTLDADGVHVGQSDMQAGDVRAGSAKRKSWVSLPIPSKRRWRPNGTGPTIWASVPSTVQQRSRMPIRYRSRRCSRSARR